jgi:vacuolar protein 8
MSGIVTTCLSCLSAVDRWCHITACLGGGRSRDGIYETTLEDNEREAVSDLLGYLENVRRNSFLSLGVLMPSPPIGDGDARL